MTRLVDPTLTSLLPLTGGEFVNGILLGANGSGDGIGLCILEEVP